MPTMVELTNVRPRISSVNPMLTSISTSLVCFLLITRKLRILGGGEERASTPNPKGPTFVGKPRIIPKDGGVLILMECKVKSQSRPSAKWSKDGVSLSMGSLYQDVFTDLGDNTYLCQLEIRVR